MIVNTNIMKQYSKAVFQDHTRTMDSIPYPDYKTAVTQHAAGVYVDPQGVPVPSGYFVETIDEALAAGTITDAQRQAILELNPNMEHRPATQTAAAESVPE